MMMYLANIFLRNILKINIYLNHVYDRVNIMRLSFGYKVVYCRNKTYGDRRTPCIDSKSGEINLFLDSD